MNPPRKLILAVQDPRLRRKLEDLLREEAIEVTYDPSLTGGDPEAIDADLVVLAGASLDPGALPDVLTQGQDDAAPGVVVLGDHGDADEVDLVTAGASAVLDESVSRHTLTEQLVELVEAEAAGGMDGPESPGVEAAPKLADFQSRSEAMRDFLDMVARVAVSDASLLVTGETGVGKERLARAIHGASPRAQGPFVTVNCGALPENLLESELFGHRKGSFTGATGDRKGHFEAAGGGTIFLDEVGEMPQSLQVKLLTVLQRHEVQPLGGSTALPVDVRVIAATNRDMASDVAEGLFREDLYFRLNVINLRIPPLRERLEDLPWLIGRFLRHFASAHGREDLRGLTPDALELLQGHAWPGNVRELINVIERAVLLCESKRIGPADLPQSLRGGTSDVVLPVGPGGDLWDLALAEARRVLVERFERDYLTHHLERTGGRLADVAGAAGINPRTLYEKMRRLGLRKEDYRGRETPPA